VLAVVGLKLQSLAIWQRAVHAQQRPFNHISQPLLSRYHCLEARSPFPITLPSPTAKAMPSPLRAFQEASNKSPLYILKIGRFVSPACVFQALLMPNTAISRTRRASPPSCPLSTVAASLSPPPILLLMLLPHITLPHLTTCSKSSALS